MTLKQFQKLIKVSNQRVSLLDYDLSTRPVMFVSIPKNTLFYTSNNSQNKRFFKTINFLYFLFVISQLVWKMAFAEFLIHHNCVLSHFTWMATHVNNHRFTFSTLKSIARDRITTSCRMSILAASSLFELLHSLSSRLSCVFMSLKLHSNYLFIPSINHW